MLKSQLKHWRDCTGKKVTSFRAPGFSITKKTNGLLKYYMSWGLQKIVLFFQLVEHMEAYHLTIQQFHQL